MAFINALEQARLHVRSLWISLSLSCLFNAVLLICLVIKDQHLQIDLPPQIPQSGLSVRKGEIPHASVYSFAFYVWQRLNHWEKNGQHDYRARIENLAPLLTRRFQVSQINTYNHLLSNGELQGRIRLLSGASEQGYTVNDVHDLGHGSWEVTLTMRLTEMMASNAHVVKDATLVYHIRIVRHDIDAIDNPWGLALDGLTATPQRIHTAI